MSETPILEVRNASKTYGVGENAVTVLQDVNLKVAQGEFIGILGPSGSGKSTLLNLMGALDQPTTGDVLIDGVSLAQQDDRGLANIRQKYIGLIFQFHHLLPNFTALENVLLPALISGDLDDPARREDAIRLLKRVDVGDRMNNLSTNLSGGQQQRVAIARALAGHKRLILADEPTGNLDTKNGAEAWRLMREFNEQDKTTFLIVTHDVRLAQSTDRIIEIQDGRIVRDERVKAMTV
ncbi:MAG: ABC transporter ATP-binding protein [Fimbriimonas sp.]